MVPLASMPAGDPLAQARSLPPKHRQVLSALATR